MLLSAFLRRRRWRYLDAALEFLVPPLSLFVLIQAVLLVAALLLRPIWAWPIAACIVITAAYVFSGLYQYRAPRSVWLGLLAVPLFLLWKIPFYVRLTFTRGPQSWERTQRHAEMEQQKNGPADKTG
jgi:4-amino-4-deoxy-L-arabinose transferase-like glycosyltransferase